MKSAAFVLAVVLIAAPAHAQLGGLLNKAQKANDAKNKFDDLNITDQEERQLGEQVSMNLRAKYGVYQDKDVTKYVSLLGSVLAQQSTRADLAWTFIVLDTDGVNAFAAPGGLIHVTRGAPRAGEERGGAGRGPRPRDHPRHREAHRARHPEGQGHLDWRRSGRRRLGQERARREDGGAGLPPDSRRRIQPRG